MRKGTIGIVREVYSKWERRAPLTPRHVQRLTETHGLRVLVQPCNKRIFSDAEFAAAGAKLSDDLSEACALFGVKQVPISTLIPSRTYCFFSHTIKAQPENLPLLDAIKEQKIRLIDYECITEEGIRGAKRLVAFGAYAGKAGMINTFRGLGQKYLEDGYSTPLLSSSSAYTYPSYDEAIRNIHILGNRVVDRVGISEELLPIVFAFTGLGKVTGGALEVFKELPGHVLCHGVKELKACLERGPEAASFIGCVLTSEDLYRRDDDDGFDRAEYLAEPELYRSVFADTMGEYCDAIVNGVYWDARFPRLVTRDNIGQFRRLKFIADISCDMQGSIEFLEHPSPIEAPFTTIPGPTHPLLMGVDILPSELPREASSHFGDVLFDFARCLAENPSFDTLPPELRGACIAQNGALTEPYMYIDHLRAAQVQEMEQEHWNVGATVELSEEEKRLALEGSAVFRITGHIFDTGLVNTLLDVVEEMGARFHIVECFFKPRRKTVLLLQVTVFEGKERLDILEEKLKAAVEEPLFEAAEARIEPMPEDYCQGDYTLTLRRQVSSGLPASTSDVLGEKRRMVTILGAGMVVSPAVKMLARSGNTDVKVVSSFAGEAEQLVETLRGVEGFSNVEAVECDVFTEAEGLISGSDAVISFLPSTMHVPIAEQCIKHGTPLVTASYVSDEMQSLHDEAALQRVPILCEMGLDPGMDHMSAMRVIDELHGNGVPVHSFRSVCGGLPAPEAANNAFGYKFSWSPMGVLRALKNPAVYLQNGARVEVPKGRLLDAAKPFRMERLPAFALEDLPNRNSLVYAERYKIAEEVATMYRGTLRYEGFAQLMLQFEKAGFLAEDAPLREALQAAPNLAKELDWSDCDMDGIAVEEFCRALQSALSYLPGERDLVLMQHTFNDGQIVSSLHLYGDQDATAMAKTVGLTAACGARLLMERKDELDLKGILLPVQKQVYNPVLDMLAEEGISFTETRQ